jgi:hypothetical protein
MFGKSLTVREVNKLENEYFKTSKKSNVPVLNLIKHYAMKAYGGVDV